MVAYFLSLLILSLTNSLFLTFRTLPPSFHSFILLLPFSHSFSHPLQVIGPLTRSYSAFCRIMEWENPLQTLFLLIAFVYTTLKIDAEYALCCPIFVILVLFTKSLIDRKSGQFRKYWVEERNNGKSSSADKYQPVAVLRVAVVGFRNLPSFLEAHKITENSGMKNVLFPSLKLCFVVELL